MTEAEWWAWDRPGPMLKPLQNHASKRKVLLLLSVALHRYWAVADEDVLSAALKVDRYLSGSATLDELRTVNQALQTFGIGEENTTEGVSLALSNCSLDFAWAKAQNAFDVVGKVGEKYLDEVEREADAIWWCEWKTDAHFVHDIFGPLPFRDVAIAPEWLTSDVLALARGIYNDKTFDQMPILADALQDAGCDNDDILNHCRAADWEHVRGCWVLDLLLGKPWREATAC